MGVLARTRPLWPVAILALPLVVSCLLLRVPLLCDGPLNTPGNLQLLAVAFALGIAARSYNLLFGYIGVLSFGHALFFGAGVLCRLLHASAPFSAKENGYAVRR